MHTMSGTTMLGWCLPPDSNIYGMLADRCTQALAAFAPDSATPKHEAGTITFGLTALLLTGWATARRVLPPGSTLKSSKLAFVGDSTCTTRSTALCSLTCREKRRCSATKPSHCYRPIHMLQKSGWPVLLTKSTGHVARVRRKALSACSSTC